MENIVVTGMGAVTPIGLSVNEYWENLINAKTGVSTISRFDPSGLPVTIGAEVKGFRADDFLPKKLVRETDIFMQFALAAAKEALRSSELNLRLHPERAGVVLGTAMGGVTTLTDVQSKIQNSGALRVSPHFMTKILGNVAAAQIAIIHGLRGPSLTVSTACSSGADAVGIAAMLLERKLADAVLAVGAESIFCPLIIAGLHAARALSTQNQCPSSASRPFDRRRDGMVLGEGAGAVVLETKSHALTRGAKILAALAGYANNGEDYHTTAPHPDGLGEIMCMKKALENAGLTPGDISYINAHGTSTPLGDKVEAAAIKAVFGPHALTIPVSSTKGATGHLMGAGGITELITCIKAIETGIAPPTLNHEEPDPGCDLDFIPKQARPLKITAALSNSFGFGGQNASLVVIKDDQN
jgi:3-oxoacyl-[acyl-carrier-protein] synthase II